MVRGQEGSRPLFPLGFGLSYASFALDGLSVSTEGGKVVASVEVRNAGRREGVATPQFYVRGTGAGAPFLRLAGWSRVALKPGERRRVDVAVDPRLLASFDEEAALLAHRGRKLSRRGGLRRAATGPGCGVFRFRRAIAALAGDRECGSNEAETVDTSNL